MLGRTPWNKGLYGAQSAWNKGIVLGSLSDDHRAAISAAMRTPEAHAKISAAAKHRWQRGDDFGHSRSPTQLELAAALLLESAGFEFEFQKAFGSYHVDFWIPSHGLVFEADSAYWHSDAHKTRVNYNFRRANPQKREEFLHAQSEIAAVIHLSDDDLKPWMLEGGQ